MCVYPLWVWVNTVLAYQMIQETGVCIYLNALCLRIKEDKQAHKCLEPCSAFLSH